MKIEVTQSDIDGGNRRFCNSCPVALAISRACGRTWSVSRTYAVEPSGRVVKLPPMVARRIERLDSFRPVKPFYFELDV